VCHGHDEIGRYFQEVFDAIPDLHVEPVAFAAEEDSVFMRSILSGTHTGGPFKGIAPTGKHVNIPAIDHFTVRAARSSPTSSSSTRWRWAASWVYAAGEFRGRQSAQGRVQRVDRSSSPTDCCARASELADSCPSRQIAPPALTAH